MDTFVLFNTLSILALPPASLAVALVLGAALALLGGRRLARWLLVMSFPPLLTP